MKMTVKLLVAVVCTAVVMGVPTAFAQGTDAEKEDAQYQEYLEKLREEAEIRWQHKVRMAEHYFKTGKKRYDERRYQDAEEDFERALTANPNHAKAKEYLAKTRRILGKSKTGEADILPREVLDRRVQLGFQKARMLKRTEEAKKLLRKEDFDTALEKLHEARNLAKVLATRVDVSGELGEINSLIDKAAEGRKKASKEAEQRKRGAALALQEEEGQREKTLQDQRVERLFERAKHLYEETRYISAGKMAEEILKIEPRNQEVIGFRDKCHETQVKQDREDYERTNEVETAATWRLMHTLRVPYTRVELLYPDNWEEICQRTAGIQIEAESPEEEKWKQELRAKLDKPVSFDFIATPLEDVVAYLRQMQDVNIVLDKQAVQDLGPQDITLKLNDVKFKDALDWILRLLDLKYALENEAIYISTKEKIDESEKTVTRYYSVSDLTVEIKDFKPNLQLMSLGEDMGGGDIFGGGEGEEEADTFTGESLAEFIKEVIAPDTWAEPAGGGGGIPF